ncbi:MAG TPA: hypothetical protein VGZ26_06250, partial [Pirellulales bacterium]|nr:hypothetical protein [Pirellulales bacterium]
MSAHRRSDRVKRARPPAERRGGDRLRKLLLAVAAMLLIARPLLPSEAVSWLGDGQPFDMLWILAATAYLVSAVRGGGLARRPVLVDGSVLLLIALCAASAIVGTRHGSPRLGINMLWDWVAFGLVFLLMR